MSKSAQQKFNEYLDECRETSDAVREMVDRSFDLNGNYAYATGYLQSLICEVIAELPKARRAQIRNQLYGQAQKHKNEMLMKTVKEA